MTSRYGRPPEFGLSPVPGGAIRDGPTRGLLHGSPEHWVETLSGFARKLGFDTFIFWPEADPLGQLDRFASEAVPALRAGGA